MYNRITHSLLPGSDGIRRWLHAATIGLALAVPAQADDDAGGYAYQLHHARTSAEQLGQELSQYEAPGAPHYVVQGPEVTLRWPGRIPAAERTPENARYPLYDKTMGLLVPHYWADGRSAAQDSGWRERNYAIYYDSFAVDFQRGDDDRQIAGHQTEHYTLKAQYVSWAEGDPRREHNDVSYDLWVLPDMPFSWATVRAVYPDLRVAVAMAEKLSDRGLVARIDKQRTRFVTLPDGETIPERHSADVVWISELKTATPPTVDLPVVEAATVEELRVAFRNNTEAMCTTLLGGDTPELVAELLDDDAGAAFAKAIRPGCEKRYGS